MHLIGEYKKSERAFTRMRIKKMTTPNPVPSSTCPHCHQPLTPGVKFCETCGARVEQAPVCTNCGAPLTPGVKFCETCGEPVTPAGQAPPVPVAAAVPAEPEPPERPAEPEEVPVDEPEPEPSPVDDAPLPESEPVKTPIVSGKTGAKNKKEKIPAREQTPQKPAAATGAGIPQKNLLIAGVVGLIVIAALAIFVIVPMLSGPGADRTENEQAVATTTASSQSSQTPKVSFEPLPTQQIPTNLVVVYQVERDPRNGIVTVSFRGGPGFNGIAQTLIRVTKSDGQTTEKLWKPANIGDSVKVQGTTLTDRVELITSFYNGESYRVYDEVFEYKQRF